MSVERRGSGVLEFFRGEIRVKRGPFLGPFAVVIVEDLGHCAPADIFDQHGLFLGGGWSFLRIKRAERFDGPEILLKLLLRAAVAQPVGFRDAITIEIAGRLVLVAATGADC